jgi:hypothetical protein
MKPVHSPLFVFALAATLSCSEDSDVHLSSEGKEMYTEAYQVAPKFIADGDSTGTTTDDPFSDDFERPPTAEEEIAVAGIPFLDGSWVIATGRVLYIKNIEENHRKIEAYLDREYGSDNWQHYRDDNVVDPYANNKAQQ